MPPPQRAGWWERRGHSIGSSGRMCHDRARGRQCRRARNNRWFPLRQACTSPRTRLLRLVALVGTGLVLLWKATSLAQMRPNQGWGFVVLFLACVAVGLTCLLVLPAATRRLRRHPDLLVPLGLYLTAEALWSLLLAIPVISGLFSPAWNLKILAFSSSLSLNFLVQVALAVTYAGWTTTLIVQAVRQDHVDPMAALSAWPTWFWRVLGAEAIGWCVLLGGLTLATSLGAVVLPLTLLLIGALSLLWNLLTAALLPIVVAEPGAFVETVRKGLRVSWERKGRWWLPVVLQMLLLGWVTLLYVSYAGQPSAWILSHQHQIGRERQRFLDGRL